MNAPIPTPAPRPYTTADILHLVDLGLIDPSAHVELIDGVLIPMSPKGRQHEIARECLSIWVKQPWAQRFNVLQEHTLYLGEELILEPDFIVYDGARRIADAPMTGKDLRLVVEVSDTSLSHDLKAKAPHYAAQGVGEYWVIDAVRREIHIHRDGTPRGWGLIVKLLPSEDAVPNCAPEAPFPLTPGAEPASAVSSVGV